MIRTDTTRGRAAFRGAAFRGGAWSAGVGLLLCGVLAAPVQAFQWPSRAPKPELPHWTYSGEQGPAQWGDLSPEFVTCKEGRDQSPIDIRYAQRRDYEPLLFQYRSDSLSVTNDGHGVRVDAGPGSFLIVDGHEYALQQYHFHTPGEHLVQGARGDMELHLVHRDAQGQVAVVAVLMKAGRRINSTLKRIAEALPLADGETFYGRHVATNPLFLLPNERSDFAYRGSLTTPPCSEGVTWFVLAEPVEVDGAVIARFRQLMGANARPVQPDNARPVRLFVRR